MHTLGLFMYVWRFVKSSRPIRVLGLKASPSELAIAMIAAVATRWREEIQIQVVPSRSRTQAHTYIVAIMAA